MSTKSKIDLPFELEMLNDCLLRLTKIGNRQPLPTQHFFKEIESIVKESIVVAYETGKLDGKNDTSDFPIDLYQVKK